MAATPTSAHPSLTARPARIARDSRAFAALRAALAPQDPNAPNNSATPTNASTNPANSSSSHQEPQLSSALDDLRLNGSSPFAPTSSSHAPSASWRRQERGEDGGRHRQERGEHGGRRGRGISVEEALQRLADIEPHTLDVQGLSQSLSSVSASSPSDWASIAGALVGGAVEKGDLVLELAEAAAVKMSNRPEFRMALQGAILARITAAMAPTPTEQEDEEEEDDDCSPSHLWSNLETRNLGLLLGRLLAARWPRELSAPTKEANAALFIILSVTHGWLDLLEREHKEDREDEEEPDSIRSLELSAICLCRAGKAGRRLWLGWPTLVDRLYGVLRSVLAAPSSRLSRKTRGKLLDLYLQVNEWPQTGPGSSKPRRR